MCIYICVCVYVCVCVPCANTETSRRYEIVRRRKVWEREDGRRVVGMEGVLESEIELIAERQGCSTSIFHLCK